MSQNILAQRAWLLSSAALQTTYRQLLKMTGGGSTLAWRPNREMVAAAWGLLGIQERLGIVGGNFKVESAPERGATLLVRIPIPKAHEKEKKAK